MQLKDVTPIISAILRERDNIPLIIKSKRYLSGWEANRDGNAMRGGLRKALRLIEQAPVADVEIVRHGRWNGWHGDKRMKNGEYRHFHYYACDQCECRTAIASNYCPNCGAKMDGGRMENSSNFKCPECGGGMTYLAYGPVLVWECGNCGFRPSTYATNTTKEGG